MFNVNNTLNHAYVAHALFAAVKAGVFDALDERPASAEALAQSLGVKEGTLRPVLEALLAFKFLKRDEAGAYAVSDKGRPLVARENCFERYFTLVWGEQLIPAFLALNEGLASGEVPFERAHGARLWAYYLQDEQAKAAFLGHMNAASDWQGPILADALDASAWRTVVDVGGSKGALLSAILKKNPHIQGVIIDQSYLEEAALERFAREGVADRGGFVAGDFLQGVPSGRDLYIIKHVLHDWMDQGVVTILSNIRRAMRPDSTLIIAEGVLDTTPYGHPWLKTRNLEQHVWTGGRVRTEAEFAQLLAEAGLVIDHIQQTAIDDCSMVFCRLA
jgi:SAM-dependent methyltransferase